MKVSEIKGKTVADFGRIDEDAEDIDLIDQLFLPAAIEHISGYVGMSVAEMDKHADLSIAVCALCVQMYDNRSATVESDKENRTVREIVEKYSGNLIPGSDSA